MSAPDAFWWDHPASDENDMTSTDYCDECEQPQASDGACYGNHGDGMDED